MSLPTGSAMRMPQNAGDSSDGATAGMTTSAAENANSGRISAVRPRLQRVGDPAARLPRHHQAERDARDGRVHARVVDQPPG